jgi:hypothetical protein
VNENWLGLYLHDAVRRRVCTRIHCTTCGARDFRLGVLRALAAAYGDAPASRIDAVSAARVTQALADVEPGDTDLIGLLEATRCLVYDVCGALGEREVDGLLGQSWAGEVLHRMQAHERSVRDARRVREEYEGPEATLRRRDEKKRLAQDRHQQRLRLKQERDRRWRDTHRNGD